MIGRNDGLPVWRRGDIFPTSVADGAASVFGEQEEPFGGRVAAFGTEKPGAAALSENMAVAVLASGEVRAVATTSELVYRQKAPAEVAGALGRRVMELCFLCARSASRKDPRDTLFAHVVVAIVDATREVAQRLFRAAKVAGSNFLVFVVFVHVVWPDPSV